MERTFKRPFNGTTRTDVELIRSNCIKSFIFDISYDIIMILKRKRGMNYEWFIFCNMRIWSNL